MKDKRWHFAYYDGEDKADASYDEKPFEIYFRDDARTIFGVLRFKRRKDNPYRDWETIVNKIIDNEEFRNSLLAPETKVVWRKNWK